MAVDIKRPTKRDRGVRARDASAVVMCWLGRKIRHVATGRICTVGTKYGMSGYWIMDNSKAQKGVVSASQIVREFELVEDSR